MGLFDLIQRHREWLLINHKATLQRMWPRLSTWYQWLNKTQLGEMPFTYRVLVSEVRKQAPKDIKIKISARQERLYSTWIGGSILASLDTFKKMWVSKREFEEEGQRAIHRKTFRFWIFIL